MGSETQGVPGSAAGKVTPVIDKVYSLAEVPDALRSLEAGDVRGKIAVAIGQDDS